MQYDAEGVLASTVDLANSWARESALPEATTPEGLPKLIDQLWSKYSRIVDGLRQVDDILIVNWIIVQDGDYRKALHALVQWELGIDKYFREEVARKREEYL